MLRLGLVDAALVGGVDTLCGSVLFGFNALQLVSAEPCRPFDAERERHQHRRGGRLRAARTRRRHAGRAHLLGYGESSDAHHMSSPHPEGLGAERALDDALARAGIDAGAVDHINLHGTASAKNDEVEAALVARRFPARTHAISTKGVTGHTLGAAGIVEAAAACSRSKTAGGPARSTRAPRRRLRAADPHRAGAAAAVRVALSNSFGFGGNNCVLVFGGADAGTPP